jgi:alanine transaminase
VRGAIVSAASEHEKAIQRGESRPFKEIVYCNIGNPQQLGQKPITFIRQVLALVEYDALLDGATKAFPTDAIARAKA